MFINKQYEFFIKPKALIHLHFSPLLRYGYFFQQKLVLFILGLVRSIERGLNWLVRDCNVFWHVLYCARCRDTGAGLGDVDIAYAAYVRARGPG